VAVRYRNSSAVTVECGSSVNRGRSLGLTLITFLGEPDFQIDDSCHNFAVGPAIPDYIATLGHVKFLKHQRVTDEFGAVEYCNEGGGRRIRLYDKFKQIQAHDEKRNVPARQRRIARGTAAEGTVVPPFLDRQ
jgi:hypothetical protein